jgi:hypothetical protein
MAAWQLAIRAIHDNGPMSAANLDFLLSGRSGSAALRDAYYRGMVKSPGRGLREAGLWSLTQRGLDFCEGRLQVAPAPWGGGPGRPRMRFVATWLSALPRDIRLDQRQLTEEAA